MYIYNSATRKKEELIPHTAGKVNMYTCGPTVYHYAHIGNLRTYICEDVLEKTLRYIGYDVKRVMNITDVGHLSSDGDTGEVVAERYSVAGRDADSAAFDEAWEFYAGARDTGYEGRGVFLWNDMQSYDTTCDGLLAMARDAAEVYAPVTFG